MTSQVPFVPGPNELQPLPAPTPEVARQRIPGSDTAETRHVSEVQNKAEQDAHVKQLQEAADSATGGDYKPARRRYLKALYEKMREIDPALKDRIDRTEAAALRRADKENPQ